MARPNTATPRRRRARLRRRLLRIHRWVGLIAALVLVVMAATGVALNHTSALGLDRAHVGQDWLLDHYGVGMPAAPVSYALADDWLSWSGDHLYWNGAGPGLRLDPPVGAISADGLALVASQREMLLLDPDGALIERLGPESLPGPIAGLGRTGDGRAVVRTGDGVFETDSEFLAWSPVGDQDSQDPTASVDWSSPEAAPVEIAMRVRAAARQSLLTWERVLLDLHSGRLVGVPGPWLWDLAAVALIFLAASGVYNALRR